MLPAPKASRSIRQPLHLTITELVVGLVLLATLAVWIPTYRNTHAAIAELSGRLTASVACETVERTRSHLSASVPALELLRDFLKADPLYGVDPPRSAAVADVWEARARLCLQVLITHPGFSMVYFGDQAGAWTGAERRESGIIVDHRWIEGTWHFRRIFRVDSGGRWIPAQDLERTVDPLIRQYDPRVRPWYRQAKAAGRQVWTDPYRFAATGRPPGITAALPVRQGRALAGAVGIDFKLAALNGFLEQLRQSGQEVFLLAPPLPGGSARIIAEPAGEIPAEGESASAALELPEAHRSANRVLHAAAAALARRPNCAAGDELRFQVGERAYLGATYPCVVGEDLQWLVLAAVPERQVLGVIQSNTFWSSLLGAAIALLGAILGVLFSAAVARPLRLFAREMAQVGDFRISDTASPPSAIREIHEMGRVLDRMKASLRAFRKYVPADVVRLHLQTGHEAALGGETARVTLMFADIAGFTTVSERLAPAELVDALAAYLDVMEAVVSRHEGLVDKYVGDSIVAFWGTPLRPHPQPEAAACAAALELQERFDELNSAREARGEPRFELRIGLHAGEAVVGNLGSQRRMGYTAMGDSVNLASRLEKLTREYGVRVLTSESVHAAVASEFETRFIEEATVRGRAAPVRVYELVGPRG